ncbi:hypothetical protein HL42_4282 [Trichophyton rubrum]|nr:hypothetical protein HL42_4282 [Trichophyton rubrum]
MELHYQLYFSKRSPKLPGHQMPCASQAVCKKRNPVRISMQRRAAAASRQQREQLRIKNTKCQAKKSILYHCMEQDPPR